MALLEEITPGVLVKGLLPGGAVTIISVKRHGSIGLELVYQDANGHLGSELLYSDSVAHLEIVPAGLPWGFDADGSLFRLVSEAYRIRLAYLFDPLIAVHTSLIEPLPHQITAVYETMLTKQPLRYLLADDPGAGKTIMTGLLIKAMLNASSVLVKPEVAAAQLAAGEPQYHRFYGSVKINPRMMALDAGKIMEEVVKHLTTLYGANVQVTLEIQATLPGGAPESTRRTVEENCRTLRFEGYGFEEE